MLKIKFQFLPLIVFGLITTSAPAHAGESFFNSLSKKFTDISTAVGDKIKEYYEDNTSQPNTYPEITPTKDPVQTPVLSPVASVKASLSHCQKFLGFMYDPTYISDPKIVAAIYLNAALDFTARSYDAKPGAQEIAERNKCVELALDAGADPDSNGETRKVDEQYYRASPVPLVRAVTNNNGAAVKILLAHKANPNVQDTTMGISSPIMNTALYKSQEMAVDLINAGIDLTTHNLIWIASANAADKVVDLIIESNQVPVNQINKFGDEYSEEEGETALDVSESNLFALMTYKKKFSSNAEMSLQDKLSEANRVLYYNYPLKPQVKASENVDPDVFINELAVRQQKVSDSLKAAGWTCKKENCGILDYSFDVTVSEEQN